VQAENDVGGVVQRAAGVRGRERRERLGAAAGGEFQQVEGVGAEIGEGACRAGARGIVAPAPRLGRGEPAVLRELDGGLEQVADVAGGDHAARAADGGEGAVVVGDGDRRAIGAASAWASASVAVTGLSQTTNRPAARAVATCSAWRWFGVAMATARMPRRGASASIACQS
jgi:hypothetical protein